MGIYSFLGLFHRFPVNFLKDVKKLIPGLSRGRNLNGEQRSVISQAKVPSDDCKAIFTLGFHKILTGI